MLSCPASTSWRRQDAALLRAAAPDPSAAYLRTRSHPLPRTRREARGAERVEAYAAALSVLGAMSFVPAAVAAAVVKERECKAKHLQLVSGAPVLSYWLSFLLGDFLLYLCTFALLMVVFAAFAVAEFTTGADGRATAGLLLLYGPASSAMTYLASFAFTSHSSAQSARARSCCCFVVCSNRLPSSACQQACWADRFQHRVLLVLPQAVLIVNFVSGIVLLIVSSVMVRQRVAAAASFAAAGSLTARLLAG